MVDFLPTLCVYVVVTFGVIFALIVIVGTALYTMRVLRTQARIHAIMGDKIEELERELRASNIPPKCHVGLVLPEDKCTPVSLGVPPPKTQDSIPPIEATTSKTRPCWCALAQPIPFDLPPSRAEITDKHRVFYFKCPHCKLEASDTDNSPQ